MSKKQRKASTNQKNNTVDDSATSLSDLMSDDVLAKLKGMKQEMKAEEEIKLEQEKEKRIQERKEREKNKSFEELLDEYGYDGTKY
ncbi:YqkE family protein [Sporosarcina ureae]|uniref:YqkE family protein n=1 Tax=Sporosarcina ureae TaxID=1571 RepID=UPI0028AE94CA|nr:YqkE family protein [Sporosarcina ureae]